MLERRWVRLVTILGAGVLAGAIALAVGMQMPPQPAGLGPPRCDDAIYWFNWWTGRQWEINSCQSAGVWWSAGETGAVSVPGPVAVIAAIVAVVATFELRYRLRGIEWL